MTETIYTPEESAHRSKLNAARAMYRRQIRDCERRIAHYRLRIIITQKTKGEATLHLMEVIRELQRTKKTKSTTGDAHT